MASPGEPACWRALREFRFVLGGSNCEEIPHNPKKIDTKGFSTESVTIFHAF